jgi:Flp pilus assembly pilin Flp
MTPGEISNQEFKRTHQRVASLLALGASRIDFSIGYLRGNNVQEFVTFAEWQGMIPVVEWWREPRTNVPPWLPNLPFPHRSSKTGRRITMLTNLVRTLWCEEQGQDIAEYAVMLAVILVIVVGTVQLIGSSANNVFSSVSSSLQ